MNGTMRFPFLSLPQKKKKQGRTWRVANATSRHILEFLTPEIHSTLSVEDKKNRLLINILLFYQKAHYPDRIIYHILN